jgi:hypothetical protein
MVDLLLPEPGHVENNVGYETDLQLIHKLVFFSNMWCVLIFVYRVLTGNCFVEVYQRVYKVRHLLWTTRVACATSAASVGFSFAAVKEEDEEGQPSTENTELKRDDDEVRDGKCQFM